MTKEQKKDLLLKDLCGRLPYGVKFLRESWNYEWDQELSVIEVLEDIDKDGYINNTKVYNVEDIKPYLFPITSMTEEQKQELNKLLDKECDIIEDVVNNPAPSNIGFPVVTHYMVDWCNKNHFDYRGLIPMGLAIDATGLNIY